MNLEGPRLWLRVPRPGEYRQILEWRNDARTSFLGPRKIQFADHVEWVQRTKLDTSTFFWVMDFGKTVVGTISLYDIDFEHRRAQYGRLLVAPEHRECHFADEAMLILLDYAFHALILNRVYGQILGYNRAAINQIKSVGFMIEGCLCEHVWLGKQFEDVMSVAILAGHYEFVRGILWRELREKIETSTQTLGPTASNHEGPAARDGSEG